MSCQNNTDCNQISQPCASSDGGCNDCSQKCHEVVDTYAEVQEYRNAFVTVRDENAVYHVDEIGNPVAVSRSAIFKPDYVPAAGDYKQNVVYDFVAGKFYVYNPAGDFLTGDLS